MIVVVVAVMAMAQLLSTGAISKSNAVASQQQDIARDVMAAKASVRALQVGVLELRLARSSAEVRNANDRIRSQKQVSQSYIAPLIDNVQTEEDRERLRKISKSVDEFVSRTQEISAKKAEIFGADAKASKENMTPSEQAALCRRVERGHFPPGAAAPAAARVRHLNLDRAGRRRRHEDAPPKCAPMSVPSNATPD